MEKSSTPSSNAGADENSTVCDGSKPNRNESSSFLPPGAIPKTRSTRQKLPDESCEALAAVTENLAIITDLNLMDKPTGDDTVGNLFTVQTSHSPSKECPSWSLPSEDTLQKDNFKKDIAEGNNNHDSTVKYPAESGIFSAPYTQSSLPEDSPSVSLNTEVENETSQYGNATSCEAENTEGAATTSSFFSSRNPLVTGRQRSCPSSAVVGARGQDLNSDQGSGNPTESDHKDTKTSGLLEELIKKIESLEVKASVLEGVLEKKDAVHADLQAQCNSLQQKLEMKEKDGKKLMEDIRQHGERYVNTMAELGTLRKENLKLSEELNSVIRQKEQLETEMQKLQFECDQLRLVSVKCRDVKMEKEEVMTELMTKTEQLENCEAQYVCLQKELEEFQKDILAELNGYKTQSEEYKTLLTENMDMLADSHKMVIQTKQMYEGKEEMCQNLEEENASLHQKVSFIAKIGRLQKQQCKKKDVVIRKQNQKYQNTIQEMEAVKKERHDLREKLDTANVQTKELRVKLQEFLGRRKFESEMKMAELFQTTCSAGTDRMNLMKKLRKMRQLARARNNRMKVEMTLVIDKRKGKRMAEWDEKSYVCKQLEKELEQQEEEGEGGGVKCKGPDEGGGMFGQNDADAESCSTCPSKGQEESGELKDEWEREGDRNGTFGGKESQKNITCPSKVEEREEGREEDWKGEEDGSGKHV